MNSAKMRLGIVGATGAVGREALDILAARGWPASRLRLFASARSAGTGLGYCGEAVEVEELTESAFDDLDAAIFSAGGSISKQFAPVAVSRGCFVIDNSSAFRMDPDVPLVIPEVNGDELERVNRPCVIANPNCSTIIALVAVTPFHRAVGVVRMVISTYQAASGAGAAAMAELEQQARDFAAGREFDTTIFRRPYLFNLFSHNTPIGEDGLNEEERKMVRETRKMWRDDAVRITATCIRVPVLRTHCESINLTFRGPLSESEAREILAGAPGVQIVDDRAANQFPEPRLASGGDDVLVGRIRADASQPEGKGLDLFVAGDQLRKGAALNAVQILEALIARSAAPRPSLVPSRADSRCRTSR